jgi:hypothetical protein
VYCQALDLHRVDLRRMSRQMFERFMDRFTLTDGTPSGADSDQSAPVGALLARLGGCTFERGLYRVHSQASAAAASKLVGEAFPEFEARLWCFGFDWLGRQFALDRSRGAAGDWEVLMFEPGTGQALEIPVPFSRFHDEELVDYSEEALAVAFFSDWMAAHEAVIGFEECVGYRTPLFLGGQDTLGNLEVSDIDIYWTIMGQLRLKAMNLPVGTSITEIRIEEP